MQAIKTFDYTPILGWSMSRYDLFLLCKRKYYYKYYAKYDPEYPRHKIEKLKNLTSVPLEIGIIVHDIIKEILKRLLKTEEKIDRKRFVDFTRRETEKSINSKTFEEIYYQRISQINIDELLVDITTCLSNFLNSKRFDFITTEAIKSKLEWIIEPPGYGETRIDGLKAYCKVDFLFPVDNKVIILDWKTGKTREDKYRNQLVGYSCWASYNFDKAPSQIIPIVVYLNPQYSEKEIEISEIDIKDFANKIEIETNEMYSFCQNIEDNIPLNKESFYKTSNNKICDYCNFRELCV